MGDLRDHERWQVFYYLRVFERESDRMVGHAIDISPRGLGLGGERVLEPGTGLALWMEVPEGEENMSRLEFDGECVWCRPDGAGRFFESGLRITGLAPRAEALVRGLIDDLELNS